MIARYDGAGMIVSVLFDPVPPEMVAAALAEGMWIVVPAGTDVRNQHVVDGGLAERPALAPISATELPADGATAATLADVPAGTAIGINGEPMGVCDDGAFTFVAAEPGVYDISLDPPFPHMPARFTVTAT